MPLFSRYSTVLPALACLLPWLALAAPEATPDGKMTAVAPAEEHKMPSKTAGYDDSMTSGSFLSARFARAEGDRDNAVRYLEEALAANPGDERLAGQLMVLYLSGGNIPAALERAHALDKSSEREKIVDLLLAVEAVQQADYKQARSLLNGVYKSGGGVWLPLFSGWLDAGDGKLKKPLKIAAVLPKGTRNAPPFLAYQLALINDVAGFRSTAQLQYETAVADYQRAPFRAVEAAANFYARAKDAEKLAQLKMDYMNTHPALSALVDSDSAAQVAALMAQEAEGKGAQARLVANTQEGVAEVLFTMASVIYSLESSPDAELYLRMALYLRPDFPLSQLLLGNILESAERYGDAALVYDGISPHSPLFTRALLRKAFVIEQQGKLEEAIRMLDERAAQYPEEYDPYVAKGDLLRTRSDFAEAAKAYSDGLARIPAPALQHWGIFFARGACYERTGQWDKAEEDLRQALKLNPDQPEVLNYLGYSLLTRDKKPEEARALIERAYMLQPDSPHVTDSMGWALYKAGDIESAVQLLEQAIELMPGDATVNEHLGDAYWQAGRKTEARYQWERALTFKPDAQQENAIRAKLRDGLAPIAVQKPDEGASQAMTPHMDTQTN